VIYPDCIYYLVPTVWLTQWRAYLGAAGKNVLAVDEPVGLEGFILSLLCQKVSSYVSSGASDDGYNFLGRW
jgi:ubiquitin carboxyl-terminal hydrolase 48